MQVNPQFEVPLYSQIATFIRHRIAAGELREGDALPSLRDAANRWGVNLHTVRRAYKALETDGLVETVPGKGTYVAKLTSGSAAAYLDDLHTFVHWVRQTAMERFAMDTHALSAYLLALEVPGQRPSTPVWVLECSISMAESLAKQIAAWGGLDARPWLVQEASQVPPGYHLTTYYHYAEVQQALANDHLPPDFFAVHLDAENLQHLYTALDQTEPRLIVCGVDCDTAQAIALDVKRELKAAVQFDVAVSNQPQEVIASAPPEVPILVSPQNWDRLTPEERASHRVFPLAFQVNEQDLLRIGAKYGWYAPRAG